MHTFLSWAKKENLDLPLLNDSPESENSTGENRVRTGYSANYPAAYVSGQYPEKYFNPTKATADLDAENMKKKEKNK